MDITALEAKLALAQEAFSLWGREPCSTRAMFFVKIIQILNTEKDVLAGLMAKEMGKPLAQGLAEISKCALVCEYYAEEAHRHLSPDKIISDASESLVCYEPLGPILIIMPWNFPFWQVFRFAAPALMAGNVVLLKHAPNVPGCAEAIEKLFLDAGFPRGCFQNLPIDVSMVENVIKDTRIRGVSLTGSDRAGRAVASQAGSAIKKVVLELGGSDPFIVLADADLEQACDVATASRTMNSGQTCISAKRFIVHESLAEAFIKGLKGNFEKLVIGDPLDSRTQIGPMARKDLLENLDRQVRESVAQGARVLCGGKPVPGKGYYYPPTLLVDVKKGMSVYDEETFGPVAAVISVKDDEDAIRVANDTPYGLAASLWTRNLDKARKLAGQIEAGCVFINGMVKSDPRLPFGGIKQSGYGRELGPHGIREFTNIKTIWIK